MRKENSDFKTSFLSEAGTFIRNKDYFAFTEQDDKACYVIARGLDSDTEKESAELAVKSVLGSFLDRPTLSRRKLKRYLWEAHELLQIESRRVRRKVSLTLVATDYTRMVWAVAGNTRLYQFRNGRLHTKSKDQSLSRSMAEAGELSEDRLDKHEERHNLLWYMGKPGAFEPFVSKKMLLSEGDVLLLCTPGLWENVDGAEMLDALEEVKEPAELVDTLEDVLLSRQSKQVPNYTAAAVYVNKVFKEDPKKKWKIIKRIALVLIPLLLLGGGAYLYTYKTAKAKVEAAAAILEREKSGDEAVQEKDYPGAVKEYSEARNAAIKVSDVVHMRLIGKKQKTAQLIVDGDGSFKDGNYAKAIESYEKAQKEAKQQSVYDEKDLEAKIAKARTYQQITELMKQGDQKLQAQDYEGAKETYAKAKKEAQQADFASGEKELAAKLEAADAKIAGVFKEKKQLDADKLEKKGDQSYTAQAYEQAVTSYAMAQEIYQEIGMLEKVLGVERKITKAQEKLNPPPQPPQSAGADGATGGGGRAPAGQGAGEAGAANQGAAGQGGAKSAANGGQAEKTEGGGK
ncbi:serine/threonine protein phosphatase [Paenibacillus sp. A3]|uniref:hypothetical protein n=1 Tax=Paenibacillus sp. A3 TaxID=1337054 RepID=UPI0006D549BE|nr:hypothetical protein [Paenibacillus sp. A3]KPV61232.1 serine/threonine protein phosphatase [Paenibacillus sp. A3]